MSKWCGMILSMVAVGTMVWPMAEPSRAGGAVTLLSQSETGAPRNTDLIVDGNVAYVGEFSSEGRVAVIDVSDPTTPNLLAVYQSPVRSATLDLKLKGDILFVAQQTGGVAVVDVSDPSHPRTVTFIRDRFTWGGIHNLFVAGDYLYMCAQGSGDLLIVDISDPRRPRLRAVHSPSVGYVHDVTVVDDIAYLANLGSRGPVERFGVFQLLDVSDPRRPRVIAEHAYAGGFCHNIWPSPDGRYVATTDELCDGGHLRIFDISDLSDIRQIGEYIAPEGESASVHNAVWVGEMIYMAYYTEGLQVVDVSDPAHPRPVGSFETWDGQTTLGSCFGGAWGIVARSLGDGRTRVYLSDITTGLWIFDVMVE